MLRLERINASWAFARPLPLCFYSWRVGGCIKKRYVCHPAKCYQKGFVKASKLVFSRENQL